jgi:Asp-tRNA(Asn)/Glu-tRNA(Gln) amidotransferase A subunit family amidase
VQAQFVDNSIDAIIMPGFAIPAFKHGSMAVILFFMQGLQYCLAFNTGWNVVHYPAGSVPVSLVK